MGRFRNAKVGIRWRCGVVGARCTCIALEGARAEKLASLTGNGSADRKRDAGQAGTVAAGNSKIGLEPQSSLV
jgi:hypothetical protein